MSSNSQGTQKDVLKKAKEPQYHVYKLIDDFRNKKRRKGAEPEYPPTFSIPNTSTIKHNNSVAKIRYLEGVDTIFQKEQGLTPDQEKALTFRNPNKITFGFGELRVASENRPLIEFLDKCSMNLNSEHRLGHASAIFVKVDEAKEKQQAIDLMKKRIEALQIASAAKDEDMLPHAAFLNIPTYDNVAGQERDMELIRLDYQEFANRDPKLFMESVNNPKMRTTAMVKKAIASGDIFFDRGGVAKWASSKAVIATIPSDRERVEYLTDFSYTEEGAGFAASLKALNG